MTKREIEEDFQDARKIEFTEYEPVQAFIFYEGAAYPLILTVDE